MGRHRIPTEVLERRGSFNRHPERRRARGTSVSPGPIGDPPDYFDKGHRAVWDELVEEAPEGFLQRSDCFHLELTVRLLVRARSADRPRTWMAPLTRVLMAKGFSERGVREMMDAFEKELTPSPAETKLLCKCLGVMGFDPRSRLRMQGM